MRGEVYGQGIQAHKVNPHSSGPVDVALFSVYNMDTGAYERRGDQFYIFSIAKNYDLPIVPLLEEDVMLTRDLIDKYDNGMKRINKNLVVPSDSVTNEKVFFEGVVVNTKDDSFKIINKHYDSRK